jgi:hypothetical protein
VKKLWIALAIVAAIFICYLLATFDLFNEDEPVKVVSLDSRGYGHSIGVYYIPANATRDDYIQIRKVDPENRIEVLESYERYQQVLHHRRLNDSILWMVLRDTSSYKMRQDTFLIKINNK